MSSPILQCPLCSKPFGVLPEQAGQAARCPHCHQAVRIPDDLAIIDEDRQNKLPAELGAQAETTSHAESDPVSEKVELGRKEKVGPKNSDRNAPTESAVPPIIGISQVVDSSSDDMASQSDADENFEPDDIEHLLPPAFDVLDPQRLAFQNRNNRSQKIILPDGKGGLNPVDGRIVTVMHKGKPINLISLPPEQLRRKRQIQNTIAILFGAIVLAIVMMLLQN